jgi:hypothetical protein
VLGVGGNCVVLMVEAAWRMADFVMAIDCCKVDAVGCRMVGTAGKASMLYGIVAKSNWVVHQEAATSRRWACKMGGSHSRVTACS